jgi:hypothetical protein
MQDVNPTLFIVPFINLGIVDLQRWNHYHLPSEFSSKVQSPISIFHYMIVRMHNTPNFVGATSMDFIQISFM